MDAIEIGPGRFGVSGAVQMFCAQHGIIDEDRSCGLVQFAPSRMCERAVDAVAHQRMGELEAVPDRTQEDISHQRVAGVERLLKQRPQMEQGEALAKDGGGLDGAPILDRQQIGAGEDNVLDRTRKPPVSEVSRAPEQLLEEQWIAAGPLDALRRESIGVDETASDR